MTANVVLADGSFYQETGEWVVGACDTQQTSAALSSGVAYYDAAFAEGLALIAGIRYASDIYPYPPGLLGVPPARAGGYG